MNDKNRVFRLSSATIVKPSLYNGELYIHFFNKRIDKSIHLSFSETEVLNKKMRLILCEARKQKSRHLQQCLETEKMKARELLKTVETDDSFSEEGEID
jgi:hypothetical protein